MDTAAGNKEHRGATWPELLDGFALVFTRPGFALFIDLLAGWVCVPGRRTITAMITVADPAGRRAHDAYHRFVRDGAWSMSALWRLLATHAIGRFAATGAIELACDDTLFHHDGRKVEGAAVFRDAVRSTVAKVVYARGLNLVVVTLRVTPPWGGCPVAVPVNVGCTQERHHHHDRARRHDDRRAAAKAIGVEGLHRHELRHTAASLAIASRADLKVVQQMLGHKSATMTLDLCRHLFGDRLDEVGESLDAAARQALSDVYPLCTRDVSQASARSP